MTGIGHSALRTPLRGARSLSAERDPPNAPDSDGIRTKASTHALRAHDEAVEGMTGIEPAPSVWKTEALPLSYIPAAACRSIHDSKACHA
jgi:hypothetical protein